MEETPLLDPSDIELSNLNSSEPQPRTEKGLVDAIKSETERKHSTPASPATPGGLMRAYRGIHKTFRGRESSGEYDEGYKHRKSVSDMETKKQNYPAHKFIEHVGANNECFKKVDLEAIHKLGPSITNSTDTYFLADTNAYGSMEALVFLGKLREVTTVEQNVVDPETGYSFTRLYGDGKEGAYGKTQVPRLVFENDDPITKSQQMGWGGLAVYKYDASGDKCSDALVLKGGKRRTRRNKKKSRKVKRKRTTRTRKRVRKRKSRRLRR